LAVLPAVVGALAATPARAGTYLQSGGDLSYSTSVGYIWATQQWDQNRVLLDSSCKREYEYNAHHLEYGYNYYYTLFGGINLARSSCGPDSKSGLGDLRLGVRGRLDVFRNNRSWELTATLPTARDVESDTMHIGCGVRGIAGSVGTKDKVLPWLALGAGAGVQLWGAPLAHQAVAETSASGAFGRWSPWTWGAGLNGNVPLNDRVGVANADLSDCGTRGKLLRGSLRLGYAPVDNLNLECGASQALIGEDVSRSHGVYCGFSRLWK
jgi:hypothetical protein